MKNNLTSKIIAKSKEKIEKEKQFAKEKAKFEEDFYRLMFELGLYNKFNKTYYLQILDKTNYGFFAKIYLEPGLSFSKLQTNIAEIQEDLLCIWIMKTKKFQDYAEVKIVTQALDENKPFEVPEDMKPNLLYLGLNFALNRILIDVNTFCHFLMAGATRSGKTRLIYQMLLCWILGCNVNEVELYLSDVAKDEYIYFQWVKHVKYYANSIEKLWKMLKYLNLKFERRKKAIGKLREDGLATNIKEYNAISKVKMSYCYVFIDEFSIITPKKSDKENEKKMKEEIMDIITELEKTGAGLGIFMFVGLQKATKQELNDSIIKNQSAVRIGFRVNDYISSEVIMEDGSAVGLDPRYAVYSLAGGMDKDYLFSPCLETNTMKELLKPYIDSNYKKIDIEHAFEETKVENTKSYKQEKPAKQKFKKSPYPVYNSLALKKEDDYIDN